MLYHYSCPGTNVGDNILTIGVQNILKRNGHQVKSFNLRNIIFDENYINKINNECHGLVIGGGGLIHCSPFFGSVKHCSGILIQLKAENIKKIKVPIYCYGLGYNVFNNENCFNEKTKPFLLELIKQSKLFSVRNDRSKERLSHYLSCDKLLNKIIVIPDPGLYGNINMSKISDKITEQTNNKKNIAIQIAADRLDYRFSSYQKVLQFVENIKKFINKYQNINFWLVPHIQLDNDFIKKHFTKMKNLDFIDYYPNLNECSNVLGFYYNCDVVIGQRGHANICPFGVNTPIICLNSHKKNMGFMSEIGFEEYTVNVEDENLDIKLSNLISKIDEKYHSKQFNKVLQMCIETDNIIKRYIK